MLLNYNGTTATGRKTILLFLSTKIFNNNLIKIKLPVMIKRIGLIKLMASSLLLLLAFVPPSCAQQQKKAEPVTKEQTKLVAVQKIKMPIDGMVCMACQSTVKKTIKSLNGVTNVEVSLEKKNAIISYYPNEVKPQQIQKAVNDKGYTAGKPQQIKQ